LDDQIALKKLQNGCICSALRQPQLGHVIIRVNSLHATFTNEDERSTLT